MPRNVRTLCPKCKRSYIYASVEKICTSCKMHQAATGLQRSKKKRKPVLKGARSARVVRMRSGMVTWTKARNCNSTSKFYFTLEARPLREYDTKAFVMQEDNDLQAAIVRDPTIRQLIIDLQKAGFAAKSGRDITEVLGELATARCMVKKPKSKLLLGFEKGVGVDQLWEVGNRIYVVEAKGPGASLTFDTHGSYAKQQMGTQWVQDRLCKVRDTILNPILTKLAAKKVAAGVSSYYKLATDTTKTATHQLWGLVVTAKWNGDLLSYSQSEHKKHWP